MTEPDRQWDAAVVGGGLSGIASAIALADQGQRVILLEQTRRLGGRASSFLDPGSGDEIDHCQHVVMGCCTNYRALIERLGVAGCFRWHREQHWVSPGGRVDRIGPGVLPAPAHHAGALLRVSFLSAREKFAIARAMSRLVRTNTDSWHDRPFSAWLEHARQPARAIDRFWRPIVVSACNAEPRACAASLAIKVFREGLLAGAGSSSIGVPTVPLARLYDTLAERLAGRACLVRFGALATRITPGTVEIRDAAPVHARRVIVALPFERVTQALDPAFHDERVRSLGDLRHSPILGVHLRLDRPVLTLPHAVLIDRPTQWVFRKDDAGRVLHAVVSAADDWTGLDDETITARVGEDLRACFPKAGDFVIERSLPVRSRRATFLAAPGVHRARPSNAPGPGTPGVFLAGDYTDTGWPATMEGAVRSGISAAALALGRSPATMLTPDLPFAPLASVVMRHGA